MVLGQGEEGIGSRSIISSAAAFSAVFHTRLSHLSFVRHETECSSVSLSWSTFAGSPGLLPQYLKQQRSSDCNLANQSLFFFKSLHLSHLPSLTLFFFFLNTVAHIKVQRSTAELGWVCEPQGRALLKTRSYDRNSLAPRLLCGSDWGKYPGQVRGICQRPAPRQTVLVQHLHPERNQSPSSSFKCI